MSTRDEHDRADRQRASAARDPDEFDTIGSVIAELDGGLEPAEDFRRMRLYRRAVELSAGEPNQAVEAITRHLLMDCVGSDDEGDDRRAARHGYTDVLRDWMNALPESTLGQVRPAVIQAAADLLALRPSQAAIYALAAVGLRDDATVAALRQVAEGVESLADLALRVLLGIRVTGEDRSWVESRILERLAMGGQSQELLAAASLLGGDAVLGVLGEAGDPDDPDWFRYSRLARLCEGRPDDAAWQDRVWATMAALADGRPNGWAELFFSGGSISECHSPQMPADAVGRLPQLISSGVRIDTIARQFHDFTSPVQIAGLDALEPDLVAAVAERLSLGATASSGTHDTPGMTAEAFVKRESWSLALSIGSPSTIEWAASAVDNEGNVYEQRHLLDELASLVLRELPAAATAALQPDLWFDGSNRGADAALLIYLASTRLAASQGTFGALDRLLSAGGLIDGHPLLVPTNAAAELAGWLAKDNRDRTEQRLVEAINSDRLLALAMSVASLREMASYGDGLGDEAVASLHTIVADAAAPSYLRADAAEVLASADVLNHPTSAVLSLCCREGEARLSGGAANALLRAGRLAEHRDAVEAVAFRHARSGGATGVDESKVTDGEAFLVGRLAGLDPDRYADAAARLIGSAFFLGASEAARGVAVSAGGGGAAPPVVLDALVERLRADESPYRSSPAFFAWLARLAPTRFLSEPWERRWDNWMADSRRALAEQLVGAAGRTTATDEGGSRRAVALAAGLFADSVYAVRRSAARAWAELDRDGLEARVAEWLDAESRELRARAAEASGWLGSDDQPSLDNAVLRKLSVDHERLVRDAADRARDELRNRDWAAAHLEDLTRPDADDPGGWALRRHRTSAALAAAGDDHDLVKLAELAAEPGVPPNVRHLYRRTEAALKDRWGKTMAKWPEPWLAWEGRVEHACGTLRLGGTERRVELSLWLAPPRFDGPSRHDWGAMAIPEADDFSFGLRAMLQHADEKATLAVDGRPSVPVHLTRVTGRAVFLGGIGPYPREESTG